MGVTQCMASFLYTTILQFADARASLSKIVSAAASTNERYEITRNGHRAAVLLGADDFDALEETLAVLSDTDLLRDHLESLADLKAGRGESAEDLAAAMKAAGRGPSTR